MSEGPTRVDPDEPILRRIPATQGYIDFRKVPPVERGAFTPNRNDIDGLSFYSERIISARRLADAASSPGKSFYVAKFKAAQLFELELSVIETPELSDLPGHLSVPEINFQDYCDPNKKPKLKELGKILADLAAQNLIIGPEI